MKPLRILIADDHDLMRRGVRALLEKQAGWKVVGEASSADEAVERVIRLRPDVVVMDVSLGDTNGLDATKRILEVCPGTEIVVLTMHESEQALREVVAAGARGYVSKSDAERDLVSAVKALAQHQPFLTLKGTAMVMEAYRKGTPEPREASEDARVLTPREREVVKLLAEGKSNKETAALLGISVKTAEAHRSNVMHKLGLPSLSHLVRYALRNKIIDEI
jgi:DNA-binding NarL/FixJ family response regulator